MIYDFLSGNIVGKGAGCYYVSDVSGDVSDVSDVSGDEKCLEMTDVDVLKSQISTF